MPPNTRSGRSASTNLPPESGNASVATSFEYHPAIAAALRVASWPSAGTSSLHPPAANHYSAAEAESMADNLEFLYGFPSPAARAAWIYAVRCGNPVVVLDATTIGFPASAAPPVLLAGTPAPDTPAPVATSASPTTPPRASSASPSATTTTSPPLSRLALPATTLNLNNEEVIQNSKLSDFDEAFRYTRVVSRRTYRAHAEMLSDSNKTWTKEMVREKWMEIMEAMIEANK